MRQTIITIEEGKDLMEDGRGRGRGKEADTEKLIELSVKNGTEYGRLLAKAQAVVDKKLKEKNIESVEYDELVDKEMCVYKKDYARIRRKISIRTKTHKLTNKVVSNIEAVGSGLCVFSAQSEG